MAIQGGWVCRACWKANGPNDDRCYRCHTSRYADEETVAARRGMDKAPVAGNDMRDGLELLVSLPAVVLSWYRWMLLPSGVLFAGLTVLVVIDPSAPSNAWLIMLAFAAVLLGLFFVMGWAVRGMRRREALPFGFSVLQSIGLAALSLYALATLPANVGNPTWENWVDVGIFATAGLLSAMGLGYCLLRPRARRPDLG